MKKFEIVVDSCPVQERGLELRPNCRGCNGRPSCGQRLLHRRQIIYLEGDRGDQIYTLVSGFLKETRTLEDGRTLAIRLVQAGDILGTEALIQRPYQCSAEAVTDATVCVIARADVERTIRERPEQGLAYGRAMTEQAAALRDAMMILGSMSAEERVRRVLHQLIGSAPAGTWIRLPLSRQELGDLLGLALGTVSRTVQRLVRSGEFEVRGRMIRLRPAPAEHNPVVQMPERRLG